MSTATALWDAPRLLDTLSRRGWGPDLDGRPNGGLRAVLRALVALLPYESAEGKLTAPQVADAAGLSVKWTRRCLAELERLELITWRRGGLDRGRSKPGWIRLSKARLAELVRSLRDALDGRRAQRRAETRHRLETTLTFTTIPPWKRRHPLSSQGELSSTLPTQGSTTRPGVVLRQPSQTLPGLGDPMTDCLTCGRPEHLCRIADAKLPLHARHPYIAGRDDPRLLVAPTHRPTPITTTAPQGWRHRVAQAIRPPQPLLTEGTDQ